MKNKVDFGKLIEKKYKGKALDLNDILEEIDLVIQESDQSWLASKVIPSNLEENPESENIAFRMGQVGNRNPVSDADKGYIPAEKIAEAPEMPLSNVRQRTIKIPDLFSTITDPKKMSVGTEDRELINNIMANIGLQESASWRERIAKLQGYVNSIKKFEEQKTDITQLISGLIFINLFKKLAFFMDQPGKQFEYLFLPFLDPKASVKGSESTELIDVYSEDKQYSLKFLKATEPTIRGSRQNLVANNGKADYIICRVRPGTGIIEFAEFLVSYDTGILEKGEYRPFKTSSKANSVWLISESGTGPRFVCLVDTKIDTVRAIYAKAGLPPPEELKREKEQFEKVSIGGLETASIKDINTVSQKMTALTSMIKSAKDFASKNKTAEANKEMQKIASQLQAFQFPAFDTKVKDKNSIKELEDFVKSIQRDIIAARSQLNPKSLEEQLVQEAKDEFEFPIQGIWPTIKMKDVSINFGNPEEYGQMTGYIAGAINNFYVDLLENLDNLTTSVTNFVATSSDTQRKTGSQTYATQSMQKAEAIKNNILDIKKSQTK